MVLASSVVPRHGIPTLYFHVAMNISKVHAQHCSQQSSCRCRREQRHRSLLHLAASRHHKIGEVVQSSLASNAYSTHNPLFVHVQFN